MYCSPWIFLMVGEHPYLLTIVAAAHEALIHKHLQSMNAVAAVAAILHAFLLFVVLNLRMGALVLQKMCFMTVIKVRILELLVTVCIYCNAPSLCTCALKSFFFFVIILVVWTQTAHWLLFFCLFIYFLSCLWSFTNIFHKCQKRTQQY